MWIILESDIIEIICEKRSSINLIISQQTLCVGILILLVSALYLE